jgi:hypothetical protein
VREVEEHAACQTGHGQRGDYQLAPPSGQQSKPLWCSRAVRPEYRCVDDPDFLSDIDDPFAHQGHC